jgi:membrane-anchored mycosin MYCP
VNRPATVWGMGLRARRAAVAAGLVVGLAAVVLQPLAAPSPAGAAPECTDPGTQVATIPWAQAQLGFERAWPLSRGDGVKVAVVDTGVDANQPALRGRVVRGTDFVNPGGDGRADCNGHGTQVAGIIAGAPVNGLAFRGVAPGATILPVHVLEEPTRATSFKLADAIRFAVTNGARVIVVPYAIYDDNPAVRQAVAAATSADVVVIAAVGEDGGNNGANRRPYPASYPDVVGVGATDEASSLAASSGQGSFVDLTAPGVNVLSTGRVGGLVGGDGTGVASAFVAGAAALVRSRFPDLPAAEVAKRLAATATPAPGGVDSAGFGFGVVSPYAAVADLMAAGSPAVLPGFVHDEAADRRRAHSWATSKRLALLLTVIGVLLALGVIGVAVAWPRGRRNRWRPRLAPPPVQHEQDHEPAPPVQLFADRDA